MSFSVFRRVIFPCLIAVLFLIAATPAVQQEFPCDGEKNCHYEIPTVPPPPANPDGEPPPCEGEAGCNDPEPLPPENTPIPTPDAVDGEQPPLLDTAPENNFSSPPDSSWEGYSDGRLSPDPAEYYSVWCQNNAARVLRGVPIVAIVTEIPLQNLISLSNGGSLVAGSVTASRSEDTITLFGSDGNLAPQPGSKSFSLSECISRNSSVPADSIVSSAPNTSYEGSEAPWEGYSDGRLNPDPNEYYSVWCRNNYVEVWRGMPTFERVIFIPISFITTRTHVGFYSDEIVNIQRVGDSVTLSGSNGNGPIHPGSKSFSLSECHESNSSEPPPDAPASVPPPSSNQGDNSNPDLMYQLCNNPGYYANHPECQSCAFAPYAWLNQETCNPGPTSLEILFELVLRCFFNTGALFAPVGALVGFKILRKRK